MAQSFEDQVGTLWWRENTPYDCVVVKIVKVSGNVASVVEMPTRKVPIPRASLISPSLCAVSIDETYSTTEKADEAFTWTFERLLPHFPLSLIQRKKGRKAVTPHRPLVKDIVVFAQGYELGARV